MLVALLVIIMLAFAWLPLGEFLPGDRTEKPQLAMTFQHLNDKQISADIEFDVRDRIRARHEWIIISTSASYAWQLDTEINTSGKIYYIEGSLRPPMGEVQRFRVQAAAEAAAVLPQQYVKVLIELVENSEE